MIGVMIGSRIVEVDELPGVKNSNRRPTEAKIIVNLASIGYTVVDGVLYYEGVDVLNRCS